MKENKKDEEHKTKHLFLRRINLNQNQNMEKDLNHYFWNVDKYFQKNYGDFKIILGNKHYKKNIKPTPLTGFGKRRGKRTTTIKVNNNNNNSNSNDKKVTHSKLSINSTTSHFGGKRGYLKNNKEGGLKNGQKYITEFELEELFHGFEKVQKMNKKKSNHFIMAKDYIDNNVLTMNKPFSNPGKFNENRKNQITGNTNKLLPELASLYTKSFNKTSSSSKTTKDLTSQKTEHKIEIFNSNKKTNFLMNDFKKNFTDINMEIYKDKKYKTATNFYTNSNYLNFQKLQSRNKLIQRQNQYLINIKLLQDSNDNKATNDYYARLLADQEQVMMNIEKIKNKKRKILTLISKKAKRQENLLLLKDKESYRIQNELKEKFCNLGAKLEPEHNYCWKRDLRGNLYLHTNNDNNPNYYNIRDPYNKTISSSFSDKNLTKKKYMKYYKTLIEENDNINKNYEGLHIKGRNLLQMEYDQFKSSKNRKIINNFEIYLPSADVEDIIFIDKKYQKKTEK